MALCDSMSFDMWMSQLELALGKKYNERQSLILKEVYDRDTKELCDIQSDSLAGVGKTTTMVALLLTLEQYYGIPGKEITALSFTRIATLELENRYTDAVAKTKKRPKVVFKTLSAICRKILLENKDRLEMEDLQIVGNIDMEEFINYIAEEAEGLGIIIPENKVRNVAEAINTLNSSLIFDQNNVESKYVFKKCGMSYEDFTKLREYVYASSKIDEEIRVGDLFLYTLELLLNNPDIAEKERSKRKLMIFDEYQDQSLIQTLLCKLLSQHCIVVGDINQQIYGFNGACADIVEKFKEYYPSRKIINLNQSYRCADEIAEFTMEVGRDNNNESLTEFKGTGKHGTVNVMKDFNLEPLVDSINNDFIENNNVFKRDIMFLFRNNVSAYPLGEMFYKKRLPFRINNYKPAFDIIVIREIMAVIDLAIADDGDVSKLWIVPKLFREFKDIKDITQLPHYDYMKKHKCSFTDVPFEYADAFIADEVLEALTEIEVAVDDEDASAVYKIAFDMYYNINLRYREHRLPNTIEYYNNIIIPLLTGKTYAEFRENELNKQKFINDQIKVGRGIRLYTMHNAKGTEADDVYVIDAESAIIPNAKELANMEEEGCLLDAANNIRNERSLCLVASSRAKENLYLCYKHDLSRLFIPGDKTFEYLDKFYAESKVEYDDAGAFKEFCAESRKCFQEGSN